MRGVDLCSQREVVFASVRDTNGCIDIFQVPLAELIEVDAPHVTISKMGMLGHYGFDTK